MTDKIVFETKTEKGTKVIVQENLSSKRENPLVEIATKTAKGEQPTNEELTKVFDTTKELLEEEKKTGGLSPQGRLLAEDTEKLVEASKRFLEQKNPDELMQKMVKEGQEAMMEVAEGYKYGQLPKFSPTQISQIQKDAQALYENVRDLVLALIRSGDLRDLLADGIDVFQDLLGAQKKGIQQGKYKQQFGQGQVGKGQQFGQGQTGLGTTPLTQTFGQGQGQQFGTTQTSKPYSMEYLVSTESPAAKTSKTTGPTPMQLEKPSLEKLKEGKLESSEQVLEAVGEAMEIPPEDRERLRKETQEKFFNWLSRLGSNPEYKVAVRNVINILDSMKRRAELFKDEVPNWEDIPGGLKFEMALKDAKRILARFVGRTALRRFLDTFQGLWNDVMYYDTELRGLLEQFKKFLIDVIENPEKLKDEKKREEGKLYLDRLRDQVNKEHYKKRFNTLYVQMQVMMETVQNDATTKDFQMRLEKFTKDFAFNKEGKPDVWVLGNSVDQLRVMMGPILKKFLENIPIDRVDILSDTYDVRIENLKISGADILPKFMDFRMDNKVHLDLKDTDLNVSKTRLVAYVHHIKPVFKDVKFQYRRKSFPKIDDFGMANIAFTGDGASLKLVWELRTVPGKPTTAVLLENRCKIDAINIEINSSQTKHSLLDRMMAVFLQQRIKHEICSSIEDYLNNNIGVINNQINSFFDQNPWEALKQKATKQIFETVQQFQLRA